MASKGFTVWLTGPSGSGKSALANELEGALLERGLNVEAIDDDEARPTLSSELGHSKVDCDIHTLRVAFVCNLLTRNDVAAICATVSPYAETRKAVRGVIGRFVEVYCRCPQEALKQRDPNGWYAKVEKGEVDEVAGITDGYEEPENAEVVCDTDAETIEESLGKILKTLELIGYIPAVEGPTEYNADEEKKIQERLRALGYI